MAERTGHSDWPAVINLGLQQTESISQVEQQRRPSDKPTGEAADLKPERRQPSTLRQEVEREGGALAYDGFSFERLRMPRSPQWSVVWSDLMMTMFIFFAVLYIYQSAHPEVRIGKGLNPPSDDHRAGTQTTKEPGPAAPPAKTPPPAENQLSRIFAMSRLALDADQLKQFAKVDLAPDKTVRIILTGDLLFDSGSAEIREGALAVLRKLTPLILQTPYMINVAGHTDDVPIRSAAYPSNWELSLARASRVARFLMQESGLAENRFYVTGYAAGQPVAANDSAEHRAANRRVEIILTREKPAVVSSAGGKP